MTRTTNFTIPGYWRLPLLLLAALLLLLFVSYWPTAASIEAIWRRSGNFAHGYLIVPIVVVLVWSQRTRLAQVAPVWIRPF